MRTQNAHKKERYQELILKEIGLFLRKNVSDPRLTFVSVTKVELNGDYSEALLYWDTFDKQSKDEIEAAIRKISGKFRHHLSQELKTRSVPKIHFVYDAQYDSEQEIVELLKSETQDS